MIRALTLILLFSSFACTTIAQKKGKVPVWIEQPYKAYDKSDFLLAIGSGSDMQAAQNNGMMNLSRIFQSSIKADQRMLEEIREISKNGKLVSVSEASELINNIRIGTNQQIKNAKVLESYIENDNRVTVLVGIERRPTAKLYSAEIEKNESQIASMIQESEAESNPVRKLTKLQQAHVLAKINATLVTQREVILERPAMGSDSESLSKTKSLIENQKKQTRVFIANSDLSADLKATLIEVFQKEGFELTDSEDQAAVLARGKYTAEPVDLGRDDSKFVKWTLVINVIDKLEQRDFFTYQIENRDGSLTEKEAFMRAEFNAKRRLKADFGKKLSTNLLSY